MDKLFTGAAAICIIVAAAAFWLTYFDAAFVAVVVGCVAWFVSFRFKLKQNG